MPVCLSAPPLARLPEINAELLADSRPLGKKIQAHFILLFLPFQVRNIGFIHQLRMINVSLSDSLAHSSPSSHVSSGYYRLASSRKASLKGAACSPF